MMVEHSKSKSTQPRSARKCPTLYKDLSSYIRYTLYRARLRGLSRCAELTQPNASLLAELCSAKAKKISICRVRASPDADVFWAKLDAEGKVVKIDKKDKKDKKWER